MKKLWANFKKIGTNKFLLLFSPTTREFLITIYYFFRYFPKVIKNIILTINVLNYFKENKPSIYENSKKALWHYCFRQVNNNYHEIYLETYKKQSLKCIQRYIDTNLTKNVPILICAVKNDLNRVKMQVNHHRDLGINNFVYIDNMSTDGTFEWLIGKGIDVYRVDDKFSATAKNAWFRQISDIYGYDRWYLILDSDELFVFPGMEKGNINDLIEFVENENMNFAQSFMIDMYPKDNLNILISKRDIENYDIKKRNCYFDKDTYFTRSTYIGMKIFGGPRNRIFSSNSERFLPLLTKNPLIYLTKNDIFGIHHSMPYYKNFNNPIFTGLLHYKFLPNEGEKYVQIVKDGNYAKGSAEYKQYLDVMKTRENVKFYYQNSAKFNNSNDLLRINIFNKSLSHKLLSYIQSRY